MKYKQLLLSSLLLAGAAHAEKVRLENRFLSREWDTEGGVLRTVVIGNKLAGISSAPDASDEFRVSVTPDIDKEGGGTTLSAKDFKVTAATDAPGH